MNEDFGHLTPEGAKMLRNERDYILKESMHFLKVKAISLRIKEIK